MEDQNKIKVIPIVPNTGGIVSPEETIGRESEIAFYWETLEKQGIALFAERRFGKSSILRKMEKESPNGFITIYKPVERITTTIDFFLAVFEGVKKRKLIKEKKIELFSKALDNLAKRIGDNPLLHLNIIQREWQNEFTSLLESLEAQHPTEKIVIILDEFSIFLGKIPAEEAAAVVGFLRDIIYDRFKNIRFVYCGSIGIDLVLDKIKNAGHNIGDPLNHMRKIDLDVFDNETALFFGQCLSAGCNIKVTERNIKYLCTKADNIPYFIDVAFDKLKRQSTFGKESINEVFKQIIEDTSSKTNLKHFFDRIENYYPHPKLTCQILNLISQNDNIVSESEIANVVQSQIDQFDRQDINRELERLKNDNYLIRTTENKERKFRFKYSLLKSWWKLNKAY